MVFQQDRSRYLEYIQQYSRMVMDRPQQLSRLLKLPAELRNQIYEYLAHLAKTVVIVEPNKVITLPVPISHACVQLHEEFASIYESTSLAYTTELIVCNENFSFWNLMHSLHYIPGPAPGVNRTLTFNIFLTNEMQLPNLQAFVKELSEPTVPPKTAATIRYHIDFEPDTFNLNVWRVNFAKLAKRYRFHYSDGEQRAFEKIYWAFAERAEEVDGVTVKQYALGCWRGKGGGLCFV
jgi:hypothetical protein